MSIEQEAAELVAAVDPAAVAAVLADFPPAEDIRIREHWRELDPTLTKKAPRDLAARESFLLAKVASYEASRLASIARYNDLRDRGLAALSPYDICISSSRDPLGALRCALRLKDAHISYDLSILVRLHLELDEVRALRAGSMSPQLALF
ncbi:hypothetical protein KXR69_25010 [Ralstonia holmesii]|uniref:hypothetical protein n=1 Tax=Burkholderiaceae TaxID=119060 RepID=UPI00222EDACC|nr:hypothetical protein [Burkholderia cenocepacia]MCW3640620.1 hypothetical protein [Burkholderia cenocepacia]